MRRGTSGFTRSLSSPVTDRRSSGKAHADALLPARTLAGDVALVPAHALFRACKYSGAHARAHAFSGARAHSLAGVRGRRLPRAGGDRLRGAGDLALVRPG